MKVMIGAGETTLSGWIATNEKELKLGGIALRYAK